MPSLSLLTCLLAYLPTCQLANLPTCQLANLPTCLLAKAGRSEARSRVLVFANTRADVQAIGQHCEQHQLSSDTISRDRTQEEREGVLRRFPNLNPNSPTPTLIRTQTRARAQARPRARARARARARPRPRPRPRPRARPLTLQPGVEGCGSGHQRTCRRRLALTGLGTPLRHARWCPLPSLALALA